MLHFIEAVGKLRKKTHSSRLNLGRLCQIAAESTAPQYYITPAQAQAEYRKYICTGKVDVATDVRNRMYLDIFEKYQKALAENNGTEFKYSIMQDILESPAPSFYIKPSFAVKFYYKAMAYKRSLARKK